MWNVSERKIQSTFQMKTALAKSESQTLTDETKKNKNHKKVMTASSMIYELSGWWGRQSWMTDRQ